MRISAYILAAELLPVKSSEDRSCVSDAEPQVLSSMLEYVRTQDLVLEIKGDDGEMRNRADDVFTG